MNKKYYKYTTPYSITFFYVNEETKNVEGVIRENKTKNYVALTKINSNCWNDIDNNDAAKNLINSSTEIEKPEYEAAELIANSFFNSDFWLLSDDDIESPVNTEQKKELIAEITYV